MKLHIRTFYDEDCDDYVIQLDWQDKEGKRWGWQGCAADLCVVLPQVEDVKNDGIKPLDQFRFHGTTIDLKE